MMTSSLSGVRRAPAVAPSRRRGNVLVLFAVVLTGLVGMVAFAIDTGYIALTKTRLQAAADAAALAGSAKTAVPPGEPQSIDDVRAEVRRYVELNTPGLTVRDEDVRLVRYAPQAEPGQRLVYDPTAGRANGVQVTLRRDGLANNPLELFFAPVIGNRSAAVAATATAYLQSAMGVYAGAPLLPYTMHIDYYNAAAGQTPAGQGGDLLGGLTGALSDLVTVHPTTLGITAGPDGVNEVVLFGDRHDGPGNFGSLDIGSATNGTQELDRQIRSGPTLFDFQHSEFRDRVAPDGGLYVPFSTTGDTGLSTSVKTAFEAILGQPRIIPLYDTVTGTGENAVYHIVGYAGVVVTKVDFNGSPKRAWVQPAFVVSNRVAVGGSAPTAHGVTLPPRLVIP